MHSAEYKLKKHTHLLQMFTEEPKLQLQPEKNVL